jgi:hypothetical protein
MTDEKNSNDILTLFKRRGGHLPTSEKNEGGQGESHSPATNTPKIIYDEGFTTNDKVLKSIMKQFINNKKHIDAVKKIDEGNYSKEYFAEQLPHYSPKLHKVLEKCSAKKTHDDKLVLDHQEGIFVLDFS